MTTHVIVGAGPAALNAVETIRAIDADAALHLVCDEPAYARMVLPYMLGGTIDERTLFTTDDAWLERLRVEPHIGRRATGIDPVSHQVVLDDGARLTYDKLLAATGSRAARPAVEGLDADDVFDMWTLDDARGFLRKPRGEVVIAGAGFIGLVILDALLQRGCRVTYLELAEQILPRMLDEAAARTLEAHLRERGVELLTGERLQSAEARGARRSLELASGRRLECDALILATGIRANVEWLEASSIEIDQGVLVDERLCTSVADIHAAGDVAQGPDLLGSTRIVHAIQPTAIDHGRVAGANMAGLDAHYSGSLVMNVLHTQQLESCSFGRWNETGLETTCVDSSTSGIYRKYVWEDDRLVGGVLVGPTLAVSNTNDVGMLKGLIQTGVSLGAWKGHLQQHPLDLRRVFVASGAPQKLLESTLLAGRVSVGGGHRFPPVPAARPRSAHHTSLLTGEPR
jgi:NADPH-dependent 2,4-dienoyl-CoA reductase/sulfur reductase-like enzyme